MTVTDAPSAPIRRSQTSFDQSAQVRPCSSQAWEEGTLPIVPKASQDDIFNSLPPPRPGTSTTVTAPSTTATAPPTTDTESSDAGHEGRQSQKRAPPSSDTSYSRIHQADMAGPSNYPKLPNRPRDSSSSDDGDNLPPRPQQRPSSDTDYSREHRADPANRHRYPKRQLRNRLLAILGKGPILSLFEMVTLLGFLSSCPMTHTDCFALHNDYGIVENRYHLTAYDCSDPTEVQAYGSIPARQCSVQATPVQREAEAIFSSEVGEKIRIRPMGPISQCGRVVMATNIEDMFLFPMTEANR